MPNSDWIEIGTQDGAPGDNFAPLLADDVVGNDVFIGGGGFDEFIGEGGDDIFVGSDAQDKMDGMSGFDWVTYKNDRFGVTADLARAALGGVGEIGDHIALAFAASPSTTTRAPTCSGGAVSEVNLEKASKTGSVIAAGRASGSSVASR